MEANYEEDKQIPAVTVEVEQERVLGTSKQDGVSTDLEESKDESAGQDGISQISLSVTASLEQLEIVDEG